VRLQRLEQQRALVRLGDVVDQQAHAHAAVGGLEQRLRHQPAGVVVLEDVGLQVDRLARLLRQHHAAEQGIGVQREQAEAGGTGGQRRRHRLHRGRDRRIGGRRDRLRGRLDHVGTHLPAGAGAEQHQQGCQAHPGQEAPIHGLAPRAGHPAPACYDCGRRCAARA
jgi:hypothetical protein